MREDGVADKEQLLKFFDDPYSGAQGLACDIGIALLLVLVGLGLAVSGSSA